MKSRILKLIETWRKRPAWTWALPLLALLDFLVYGHVLFSGEVLSRKDTDLSVGIWGLDFIFGELARGNLPLWNPYILCGTPCFASFQTLAFYPPAWPFMVLPLGLGCNLYIIFHVFWMGAGMFWWLSRRSLHPLACMVGAALLMFGSTTTLKIYPGHISVLSAMSWASFLLVVFDALLDAPHKSERRTPWVLLGIFCVAMQIAAGFPQHVFYTAGIGGIYFLARLLAAREYSWRDRARAFAAFCGVYCGGALLMMVQLLTSWQTSKETARAAAMSFKFVSMSSFPPENFLTLLAPTIFGGDSHLSYWGRWYAWEATLYLGVGGLLLLLCGLRSTHRARWLFSGCAVAMLLLALGKYTPFLRLLYDHVPVFGSFRSSARALFEASVFLCALAVLGLDDLLRAAQPAARTLKVVGTSALFCAVFLMALGFWAGSESAMGMWREILASVAASKDYFVERQSYSDPQFMALVPVVASRALLLSGLTFIGAGLLLRWAQYSRRTLYMLGAAAILEVAIYALVTMPTFPFGYDSHPEIEKFLRGHPGDYRFIKSNFDNLAMRWRAYDMGGYESFRLRRYDEFAQWSQGHNPDITPTLLHLNGARKIYSILRCRYAFAKKPGVRTLQNPLPHVLLVSNYRVLENRDAIFKCLDAGDFDPRREVILESKPNPLPVASTRAGMASVKVLDTDTLEIEATTSVPALLLVTDSYSKGWKATALPGSVQQEYSIMPANYVIRAIPLQSGTHRIRMEYLPSAFVVGKWISLAALLVYALLLAWLGITWKAMAKAQPRMRTGLL
jgi:hypothetical protein